jgi:hypothetical protein
MWAWQCRCIDIRPLTAIGPHQRVSTELIRLRISERCPRASLIFEYRSRSSSVYTITHSSCYIMLTPFTQSWHNRWWWRHRSSARSGGRSSTVKGAFGDGIFHDDLVGDIQ